MSLAVMPDANRDLPMNAEGYAVGGDFFPMFDVPFRFGSGWTAQDDEKRAADVVISGKLNQEVFAGANSVGRTINLGGRDYRVVGVTNHWNPRPRFYDLFSTSGFADEPDFYMPFNLALQQQMYTGGRNSCRGHLGFTNWTDYTQSNCVWITPWVVLDTADEVASYRRFLTNYAADQQRAGRFNWAPNVRLRDVTQWLDYQQVVPPESRISLVVALGFFVICLVNTIGLLLAKFMRRAGEIGVRRALGATRREIYTQYLVEAATVGLAGGVLGLLLTAAGVSGVGILFQPEIARLARQDGLTVLLTTHYLDEADHLAAQLVIVDAGRVVAVGTPEQLKSELGGDTIQVGLARPAEVDRARQMIGTVPGVSAALVEGAALHARVNNGAAALPAVLAALDSAGIELASVSVARPSLDDVYLHHAGRSFREADRLGVAREVVPV